MYKLRKKLSDKNVEYKASNISSRNIYFKITAYVFILNGIKFELKKIN